MQITKAKAVGMRDDSDVRGISTPSYRVSVIS
jgi:hypothetical protein